MVPQQVKFILLTQHNSHVYSAMTRSTGYDTLHACSTVEGAKLRHAYSTFWPSRPSSGALSTDVAFSTVKLFEYKLMT